MNAKLLSGFLATTLLLTSTAAIADGRAAVQRLPATSLNEKPLPFSDGVRVKDMLYLSGQIGVGSDGKLPPSFEAQTRNALDKISTTLKGERLAWKDVTRCLVLMSDMANWPVFNTIYSTYVDPENLPARSALGASGLALGALVEVQCEAYDPPR